MLLPCLTKAQRKHHRGECIGIVVHNRASVVGGSQVIDLGQGIFLEVVLHAGLDVVPIDDDIVVSVRTGLLMPKS